MNRIACPVTLALTLLLACASSSLGEAPASSEIAPAPVGGMSALAQAVIYPETALKDGLEGKVLLSVQIDATGELQTVEVISSVRKDLDEAAMAAVRSIGWTPAQKDNVPVETTIVVPIQFKLDSAKKQK